MNKKLLKEVTVLLAIALPTQIAINKSFELYDHMQAQEVNVANLTVENGTLRASLEDAHQQNTELQDSLNAHAIELEEMEITVSTIEETLSLIGEEKEMEQRVKSAAKKAELVANILRNIPSMSPATQRISSFYGLRTHPVTKRMKKHRGLDYLTNVGTPIYAPADGIVTEVRPSNKGSGNFLKIQHLGGFTTSYSHLKNFLVKRGDPVKQGQRIALSGNSGLVSGPHLHYEVRWLHRDLDPRPFTNVTPETYATLKAQVTEIPWEHLEATFGM